MATVKLTLSYQNEDDRAYGLAGMAISLAALDAIDRVASVSLDSEGPMVNFSNEYYFSGSPSVSPKATWNTLLHNFYITSAMAVSNVMARSLVRLGEEAPQPVMEALRAEINAEGIETCALEEDEVDRMYRKTIMGMRRIFGNRRLHPAIGEFARMLSVRRELTGTDIYDELRALNLV